MYNGNEPQGENCGNCRFYGEIKGHGLCRNKPPKTFVVDAGSPPYRTVITRFPETNKNWWCGHYYQV